MCSSPTERFQRPPAASSATNRFIDLARLVSITIPPSSATAFATFAFTDRFAIAYRTKKKMNSNKCIYIIRPHLVYHHQKRFIDIGPQNQTRDATNIPCSVFYFGLFHGNHTIEVKLQVTWVTTETTTELDEGLIANYGLTNSQVMSGLKPNYMIEVDVKLT